MAHIDDAAAAEAKINMVAVLPCQQINQWRGLLISVVALTLILMARN